jgi:hypothetical protein
MPPFCAALCHPRTLSPEFNLRARPTARPESPVACGLRQCQARCSGSTGLPPGGVAAGCIWHGMALALGACNAERGHAFACPNLSTRNPCHFPNQSALPTSHRPLMPSLEIRHVALLHPQVFRERRSGSISFHPHGQSFGSLESSWHAGLGQLGEQLARKNDTATAATVMPFGLASLPALRVRGSAK